MHTSNQIHLHGVCVYGNALTIIGASRRGTLCKRTKSAVRFGAHSLCGETIDAQNYSYWVFCAHRLQLVLNQCCLCASVCKVLRPSFICLQVSQKRLILFLNPRDNGLCHDSLIPAYLSCILNWNDPLLCRKIVAALLCYCCSRGVKEQAGSRQGVALMALYCTMHTMCVVHNRLHPISS